MAGFGACMAYAYLLRVPLGVWLVLVLLPLAAVPENAPFRPLLGGIFDVGAGSSWMWSVLVFAQITVAGFMAATAVGVSARLIVTNGKDRFGLVAMPSSQGLELAYRVFAFVALAAILLGAMWEVRNAIAFRTMVIGIVGGCATYLLATLVIMPKGFDGASLSLMKLILRAPALLLRRIAGPLARLSPSGYQDAEGRPLSFDHWFAAGQLGLSLTVYGLLFFLKKYGGALGSVTLQGAPRIPTLCLLLVLLALACWTLSAFTFFMDRFRVPVIAAIALYAFLVTGIPQANYFYRSSLRDEPLSATYQGPSPAEVLGVREKRPAIVVAASGGGIQAAAWTAQVLTGLSEELGEPFDRAVRAISSVSGGSVGAMFFVNAYGPDGALSGDSRVTALERARASSLDEVAWGLVYPDLFWAAFPFLKGLYFYQVWPPRVRLVSGLNLTSDRGAALERAWAHDSSLDPETDDHATLAGWARDAERGMRPAILFNATLAETGQRFLLGTTDIRVDDADDDCPSGDRRSERLGRRTFWNTYAGRDLDIVTAARLSATFPYVTPAARIWREEAGDHDVFAKEPHVVDGGYYDNFGVVTLVEWLDHALCEMNPRPSKLLILQIRDRTPLPRRHIQRQGWLFQTLGPISTMLSVRETGQRSHALVELELLRRLYPGVEVVDFEFPNTAEPPLSWHLTPDQREAIGGAWKKLESERTRVAKFLADAPNQRTGR